MKVTLGEAGLANTWQSKFPATTKCCHCGGEARIAFVAHEGLDDDDQPVYPRDYVQYVTDLHRNGDEGALWLHDCACFAVYLCRDSLEPTALYNQA